MKGNPADAVEQGAHAMFFPCGLGHMMGLDVHDMETSERCGSAMTDNLKVRSSGVSRCVWLVNWNRVSC